MDRQFLVMNLFAVVSLHAAAPHESALWGRDGSKWDPAGSLPDVSHSGYACGEQPIPDPAVTANVRDFGAKGDGITDDSDAFLAAIENTGNGAILVPAGRYRITKILEIRKPGLVLRGAGPAQSILVCPTPLNDIRPNWGATTGGRKTSNYSWSGGIVWFKGSNPGKPVGKIGAPAKRGDHQFRLAGDPAGLAAGAWIEIQLKDDEHRSLLDHLYSGDPGDLSSIKPGTHRTSFVTRIRSVHGYIVETERPLRTDLLPEWQPVVRLYAPTVFGSGVENLGFEFPKRTYEGHFTELGFNAVAFNEVAHCWARNLVISNSDSGVFAGGRFCTVTGIRMETQGVPGKNGEFGHHGITLSGHDNLCTSFDIRQKFIHDLSVEGGAGNVFSSGRGIDLCFDHHKRAPYENVFTDIDAGSGTRLWKCGGGDKLGRQCGARGTFWNIRASKPQPPPKGFGPASMNLVGIQSNEPDLTEGSGPIEPANLYQAQLRKRLGSP